MVRLPVINSAVVRPPLPFYSGFTGDAFPQLAHLVLPNKQQYLPGGKPPPPSEFVDLAVVGGGLAGLTLLRASGTRSGSTGTRGSFWRQLAGRNVEWDPLFDGWRLSD